MSQVMLQTDALQKSFTLHLQGGVRIPVLSGIGLVLRAGECVVLSGPSGVGKSTLIRSLYGNYRAEAGRILIRHHGEMIDLATADPRTILAIRHETLGYVSQFLRVVPRVSALDIVAEVPIGRGATPDAAAEHPPPAALLATRHLLRR
jgi:alpha-D-ribose 1-methylphosphonate 5-triphosphate synthase subunit PhnL